LFFLFNFLKYAKRISNFKQVNQFFFIPLTSYNSSIDKAASKNVY
jgi:hypothetical protein